MAVWRGHYPTLGPILMERLRALAADPDPQLGGMIPPTSTRPCYIDLSEQFPPLLLITLYVQRHDDEGVLFVESARMSTHEDEPIPPSEDE
jgi:hypothetical protein